MGVLYLGSYLRQKRPQDDVALIDLRLYNGDREQKVRDMLRSYDPHIVGISAITMEAGCMHAVASWVKEFNPDVPVIAGGPHPTSYVKETLADPNIDIVVQGEGEETFCELIGALEREKALDQVLGITFKDRNGNLTTTGPRPAIANLDSMPFPAWDLLELEGYFQRKSMSIIGPRRYMTLFTSRACPYRCNYCHDMFGKTFRERSPENVMQEIEILVDKYGITHFEIIDDIFNLNYRRAYAIFEMLAKRGLGCKFAFPNGVRSDLLDKDMLTIWRRGGTVNISFAIETASPRLQKLIRKRLKIEKAKKAIEIAADLGILCNGFFMLGFPTETREEVQATINFAVTSKLHTALFFIVTPFQGTDLFEEWGHLVDLSQSSYEDYDYFRGNYNMSSLSTEELYRQHRYAYRRFYLNPTRIFRIYKAHPMKSTLANHGWMALRKFIFNYRGNVAKESVVQSQEAFFG